MVDFGTLIFAHLIGDYLFQNDWMAQNKEGGFLPCFVHCMIYTLCGFLVVSVQGARWPSWSWAVVFSTHMAVDYTGFAKHQFMDWMDQTDFRKHMGPWSSIIIDNVIHLLVYFVLWVRLCSQF